VRAAITVARCRSASVAAAAASLVLVSDELLKAFVRANLAVCDVAGLSACARLELIAAPVTNAMYIDPLQYVTVWGRTDQGVDASMPVGAPILAPSTVKVLAIIPGWYAGQPLVYFELLNGPDAGKVQFVAEQITSIAPPGAILQQGQPIARFAPSGTAIEYGWSTLNGVTLAKATTGYEEGQVTPAGQSIRAWLNSLGANAGNG